jgi:16S rRNA (adenine1518-N6/adenine1519-N6)-dimethyltransferase
VAEAITARPGRMSLLAVAVQVYAQANLAGNVSATSFYPVPGVDSSIVKMNVYPEPKIQASRRQDFFRLVRAGFSAPRKQIINNISRGLGLEKDQVALVLEAVGIDARSRAQDLAVEDWSRLQSILEGAKIDYA